ncbi:MAG TPA: sigma-70 family RNA polymerase sigma factor [Myxococcota bacterium]|nr:sigma-70 family RNA polymerase sigma factor [Myxococcota bacterium]
MASENDQRTDESLMEQVQAGEEAAFAELFSRYRLPLYGYIRRMVHRGEVADELFQDSFLNVHRFRSSWKPGQSSFRAWLFRIATNLIRDKGRALQRRPELLSDSLQVTVPHGDPLSKMALERALSQLPDNLRDAFLLGALEGLDHHELALALSIEPDNARARLSRARSRLRELLEYS